MLPDPFLGVRLRRQQGGGTLLVQDSPCPSVLYVDGPALLKLTHLVCEVSHASHTTAAGTLRLWILLHGSCTR